MTLYVYLYRFLPYIMFNCIVERLFNTIILSPFLWVGYYIIKCNWTNQIHQAIQLFFVGKGNTYIHQSLKHMKQAIININLWNYEQQNQKYVKEVKINNKIGEPL